MKRLNLFMLPILLLLIYSCSLSPRSLFPGSKSPDLKPKVETKTTVSTSRKNQKKPVPRRSTTKMVKPVVQELPEGWTVDRHPVAKWGMSLPTVMSNVLDSAQSVEYWEEVIDLPTGYKVPLKRAKVYFQIITRLTIESVELHFMNINHIYSNTNHEPSHYIMNGIVRGVELKPTGFPQLTSDDIIKYKFLMNYGTPKEFSGGFHHYENKKTIMKVRDLDSRHVQIQMNSPDVDKKLLVAIDDMYSTEGIEYQKKLLLRSIDF
jgi:hypothetical protein